VRKLSLLSEALLRLRTVVAPQTAVALKAAIALQYRCQAVVNFKQSVRHGCGGIYGGNGLVTRVGERV